MTARFTTTFAYDALEIDHHPGSVQISQGRHRVFVSLDLLRAVAAEMLSALGDESSPFVCCDCHRSIDAAHETAVETDAGLWHAGCLARVESDHG